MSCRCSGDDLKSHAKTVEDAIFQSLMNIYHEPEREEYWRKHADKLEHKFMTEHGRHHSYFIQRKF